MDVKEGNNRQYIEKYLHFRSAVAIDGCMASRRHLG